MSELIAPHGGILCDQMLDATAQQALKTQLPLLNSWCLNPRQLCDVEMILNGGLSPLTGFMSQADYHSVIATMRLADKTLWPMPITLDVSNEFANKLILGEKIILRDSEGNIIALLEIQDIWGVDKAVEAKAVYGTLDEAHPGVKYLMSNSGNIYLGGRLYGMSLPKHYDFLELRAAPRILRETFKKLGWKNIVGFQTRNPMHRAHQELTMRAAKECRANLLIQPVVGMTKPGDIDYFTRVRCYKKLLNYYNQPTMLNLLPLAMRMAGPREALWHAIIRQNYGCSHFIVGRDHASPGKDSQGNLFYGYYDAQTLLAEHQNELAIKIVSFKEMVYVKERMQYAAIDEVQKNETVMNISGTELRERLHTGGEIPTWFTYAEIIEELRCSYPARLQQGFTLFFTGLSAAGKSTIAKALLARLMALGGRQVTLLDGDEVRRILSSGLGFSRQDRDLNIVRIGYLAAEITKHRGIAICAAIAPYRAAREEVRRMVSSHGGFIEIYVSTPLEICEKRDPKGLYVKARNNFLPGFTGISDPYEMPEHSEIALNTRDISVDEATDIIISKLTALGYLKSNELLQETVNTINE